MRPDYRRTFRLTAAAKRFAASVMHHAIRLQNPADFGMARLAVFQFPQPDKSDSRVSSLELVSDANLYDREQLAVMIAETFEMWDEVLAERTEKARRSGTG
jgi:hypothetical protein